MLKAKLIKWSRQDKNYQYPLYLRYRDEGKNKYIKLGFSIWEREWDDDKKRLKRNCRNYKEIHEEFDKLEEELYQKLENGETLAYSQKDTLFYYIDKYVEFQTKNTKITNVSTIKSFYGHVKRYTEYKNVKISQIDKAWIRSFYSFLKNLDNGKSKTKNKKIANTTVNTYFVRLSCFFDWLEEYENIFIKRKFMRNMMNKTNTKKAKVNNDFKKLLLVLNDYRNLRRMPTKSYKNLCKYALSYFLYGMRASDAHLIKWSNFYIERKKVVTNGTFRDKVTFIDDIYIKYTMFKTNFEHEFRIPKESYKYFLFFLDKKFQLEYGEEYNDSILRVIGGRWTRKRAYDIKERLIKEHEEGNNHRWDEIFDEKWLWHSFDEDDYVYPQEYAKDLLIRQIKGVESGKINDGYVTQSILMDIDSMSAEQRIKYIKTRTVKYNSSLTTWLEKLGLQRATTHTCRHTFVANAVANKNIKLEDISQALNHQQIQTTQTYIKRFTKDELSDSMDEMFK